MCIRDRKWARQEGIECYRLYDADLPEYNVAVDRYADWVVVQEYAPPKTIDAHKARQRLFDIIAATISVCLLYTSFEALVRQKVPAKPVNCMGLTFKNPLGLAAGLDKDGECIDALGAMGFGSIEIGTVTPRPQPGNDKPRLFRLVDAEGLIRCV